MQRILDELNSDKIMGFANMTDLVYETKFITRFIDFASLGSALVSNDRIAGFYRTMKQDFPTCHFVFATFASGSRHVVHSN